MCCIDVLLDVCDAITICDMCDVITDNKIGYKGAKALSQCLPHLTQLTHFYLRGECVHINVLLGVCGV